jgi:hypothetical protein
LKMRFFMMQFLEKWGCSSGDAFPLSLRQKRAVRQ